MRWIKSVMIILTIVLFTGLSSGSCNDESQKQTSDPATNVDRSVIDSISNIKAQIETISKEWKEAVDDVSEMHTTVSNLQNRAAWFWVAIFLAISAFVLSTISFKICSGLKKRADHYRKEIEELKGRQHSAPKTPRIAAKPAVPVDYERLKYRVSDLERQVKQLSTQQSPKPSVVEVASIKNDTPSKTGYFGAPVDSANEPYFPKLLAAGDSDARFSVEIKGETAIFKPIDDALGTIVSSDAVRRAIEFNGCAPDDNPSSMQVIMSGEAVQRDSRWYINKKAQVNLSK